VPRLSSDEASASPAWYSAPDGAAAGDARFADCFPGRPSDGKSQNALQSSMTDCTRRSAQEMRSWRPRRACM